MSSFEKINNVFHRTLDVVIKKLSYAKYLCDINNKIFHYIDSKEEILTAASTTVVKLFEGTDCSGMELEFKVSNSEPNCKYCLDTCGERFTTNPDIDAHTRVRSVHIYDTKNIGFIATTYNTCSGSFGYVDPGFQGLYVKSNKCIYLPYGAAFLVFWAPAIGDVTSYVKISSLTDTLKVGGFKDKLKTGHWSFGPSGSSNAVGTSWYTFIFDLLDPKEPRPRFQTGTGGTWLKPAWTKPYIPGVSGCYCDPKRNLFGVSGCSATDKTTCTQGCCLDGCRGLYQTLEGGTGYWLGQLPTSTVKWRINAVNGCYKIELSGVLSYFGSKKEIPCTDLGVIIVSNSYLLPLDGIAFDGEGMLGQAWIDTPLGVFDEEQIFTQSSRKNRHWSLILDTKNFKGPIAYILPEFWAETEKWVNFDGKVYPEEDFSKTGINTGGGAFEWHTIPVLGEKEKDGDIYIRIPKMRMGKNKDDKTVLMTGFKSWEKPEDLYTLVDNLMSGTVAHDEFDESEVMKNTKGSIHKCPGKRETYTGLGYNRNNGKIFLGGTIFTEQTGNDNYASCQAIVTWDETKADCSFSDHCKFTEVYKVKDEEIEVTNNILSLKSAQMEHVTDDGKIPTSLKTQNFPKATNWVWDRTSEQNLCGSSPSDKALYCKQSAALDWIGYRWYRFNQQPGLQRLNLKNAQKNILQQRIERLHKALNKNPHMNDWLKPPVEGLPELVNVDPAHLIDKPPKGMEVGYVPIVVYQGMEKPIGCIET